MKRLAAYAGLVAVAVALDQWIKYLVETRLVLQEPVDLLPFLALYRTYNTGVAFSMLSSFGDIGLIVVSLAVIAFVLYLASRSTGDQWLARIGFALIIGGAIGNLIDRADLRPRHRLHPVPYAGLVLRRLQPRRRLHHGRRGDGAPGGVSRLAPPARRCRAGRLSSPCVSSAWRTAGSRLFRQTVKIRSIGQKLP